MSISALYYYTVQSNIIILVISIIYLLFYKRLNSTFYKIKYFATVGITITFLVFFTMLTPQLLSTGDASYLLSVTNITLHLVSPLLAMISFIKYDKVKFKKYDYLLGTIMPLIYMFFTYGNALLSNPTYVDFSGNSSKYPYFFFDYETNGWFTIGNGFFGLGTFYWILILITIVILISKLFIFLNKKTK